MIGKKATEKYIFTPLGVIVPEDLGSLARLPHLQEKRRRFTRIKWIGLKNIHVSKEIKESVRELFSRRSEWNNLLNKILDPLEDIEDIKDIKIEPIEEVSTQIIFKVNIRIYNKMIF